MSYSTNNSMERLCSGAIGPPAPTRAQPPRISPTSQLQSGRIPLALRVVQRQVVDYACVGSQSVHLRRNCKLREIKVSSNIRTISRCRAASGSSTSRGHTVVEHGRAEEKRLPSRSLHSGVEQASGLRSIPQVGGLEASPAKRRSARVRMRKTSVRQARPRATGA